jgi:hypothetical protein
MTAEETGRVASGRRSTRQQWGPRKFLDEKRNDTGELLFIGSKISAAVLNYNHW